MLFFRPHVEELYSSTPLFYVYLVIHDLLLHNNMLDSRASHNLMLKSIMETLNLDITRPYKDLFSFDSSKVKCLGLIKYLYFQYPEKSIVMDIVVANVCSTYCS